MNDRRLTITERMWRRWRRLWTRHARAHGFGRIAARLAAWNTAPYHGRSFLAAFHSRGYVAPSANLAHPNFQVGTNAYVGDGVYAFCGPDPGPVKLEAKAHLYGNTQFFTDRGATITIGPGTHVHLGCYFCAAISDITIGRNVGVAAQCAFYSYNHGFALGTEIRRQKLVSNGPIIVGDSVWFGHGVTVLSGVRIGTGAVIGAGAIVTRDIPDNAIAGGMPARVLSYRR